MTGTVTAINASDGSMVLDDKVNVLLHQRVKGMSNDAKVGAPIKVAGILRREDRKLILNPGDVLSSD